MSTASLSEKVYAFTVEKALFSAPATVVVGVSGGADSMALLHVLHTWRDGDLRVIAVHIHHGLRGAEADRDEAFVREYCVEHGIDYVCERVDVRAISSQLGVGEEEAGRRVRYEVFERIRADRNADVIATAHNADDTAETMLMHILRGCGVGGLCGVPEKRGYVVRPLLCCTREEIEAYCAENDIPYVTDSTNAELTYTRNRVRHQLLPLMQKMNPSVNAALERLRTSAARDEAFFNTLAANALTDACFDDGSFSREVFLRQEKPVRVRMWKAVLLQNGCATYTETHVDALESALAANRGTVYLPDDYSICVSADRVKCFAKKEQTAFFNVSVETLPFRFVFDGREHILRCMSGEEITNLQNVHKKFFNYAVDCDKIQGNLTVRRRQDGDKFHPAGRKVGKTLKALFQEMRIPTYERNKVLMLCDEQGIVWVSGIACDDRVCPNDSTKHFLVWLVDGKPSYTLYAQADT